MPPDDLVIESRAGQDTYYRSALDQLQAYVDGVERQHCTGALSIDSKGAMALALANGDHFYIQLNPCGREILAFFRIAAGRQLGANELPSTPAEQGEHAPAPCIHLDDDGHAVVYLAMHADAIDPSTLGDRVDQLHDHYMAIKSTLR